MAAGRAETMQEVAAVVGILAGGVKADDKVDRAMLPGQLFEALTQEGVADGRRGERLFGGSGLQVVLEEGGVGAVAGGVDADADAAWRLRKRSLVW